MDTIMGVLRVLLWLWLVTFLLVAAWCVIVERNQR